MSTITLDRALPCSLDASALYGWLIETLHDTDRVDLWPRRLNRVRIPRFEVGQRFEAEYRSPLGTSKSPYLLVDHQPGKGFAYSPAKGHPFRGRIRVEVEERHAGSTLHWFGTYEAPFWRPERAFFRLYFEPRFFAALGEALSRLGRD